MVSNKTVLDEMRDEAILQAAYAQIHLEEAEREGDEIERQHAEFERQVRDSQIRFARDPVGEANIMAQETLKLLG